MSLQLIYGRSGTGKSQLILDEIKEKINENKKIYIIVPEQYSFSMEKRLLNTIGTKSIINAEVLTLSRMATRVVSEVSGNTKARLSKIGKAMIVYSCAQKLKSKLVYLNDSNKNLDLILNSITEFKKHSITENDINSVIEKTDDEYLKIKLNDIKMVLDKYNKTISNSYIDESDLLGLLIDDIDKTDMFNDTLIYYNYCLCR